MSKMNEFKGTKGKWEIKKNDYYIEIFNISDNDNYAWHCNVHFHKKEEFLNYKSDSLCDENLANALLISKSPEMLEMLIQVKDYLGSDIRSKVEKLIKEATNI